MSKKLEVTVNDVVAGKEKSPLPLEVIPNYMGINLVSVDKISWIECDDGQIEELTIHFIPDLNGDA